MKLSESNKKEILKRIEKLNYPDNLSRLLANSFSPQLALVDSFNKQIEETLNRHNQLINSLANPFVETLTKQMQALSSSLNVFHDKHHNIIKEMEQHWEKQARVAEAISNSFLKMALPQINLFDNFSQQISNTHKKILSGFTTTAIQNIEPLVDLIENYRTDNLVQAISTYREIYGTTNFGQNIVLTIDEIKRQEEHEQILRKIEELFKTQIQKNPKSLVASSSFQNLIYFLLSIMITIYLGDQQEARIIKSINETGQKVEKKLDEITPQKEIANIYIVRTKLNVRSNPNSKSLILDTLYPNNKVEVFKEENNWYYIEYFDFVDGVSKTGWIYSKYVFKSTNVK